MCYKYSTDSLKYMKIGGEIFIVRYLIWFSIQLFTITSVIIVRTLKSLLTNETIKNNKAGNQSGDSIAR